MDFFASTTTTFDQIDELFQFSSMPCQEHQLNELDGNIFAPLPPHWFDILGTEDHLGGPAPSVKPLAVPQGDEALVERCPIESSKKKKIIHRDVERQRRQEMATLYRSLKAHLPRELLKGKRSTADHIQQAIGYIKYFQDKIKQLSDRREKLKTLSALNKPTYPKNIIKEHPRSQHRNIVKIEPFIGGIEITVSTDSRRGIALSKVLGFLIREGVKVVSCTSTRVNERLIHSIKSEVIRPDGRHRNNLSLLKEKLMSLLH